MISYANNTQGMYIGRMSYSKPELQTQIDISITYMHICYGVDGPLIVPFYMFVRLMLFFVKLQLMTVYDTLFY